MPERVEGGEMGGHTGLPQANPFAFPTETRLHTILLLLALSVPYWYLGLIVLIATTGMPFSSASKLSARLARDARTSWSLGSDESGTSVLSPAGWVETERRVQEALSSWRRATTRSRFNSE